MQIRVKCNCAENNCPEWAIVELQGVIEPQSAFKDCLQNLEIGQLCRPPSHETYTFTDGYHKLTESKVTSKKPMVILKKTRQSSVESNDGESSTNVALEVVGIIQHRILFKTRPKALISSKIQFGFSQMIDCITLCCNWSTLRNVFRYRKFDCWWLF
ncbi:uncharacterized protein LOC127787629 [Diospyros lotus]|uniref:uncharacterized protein LOC127787629 n=1 Tax=Diospyros lotus TaxID=55363 RepID=UPI002254D601|nr:uncharacterized protein LOC127787629 [Diospyros lotus]